MTYVLLARLTLLVHLLFILTVVLGGIVVLFWRRFAWIHGPIALWGAGIVFFSAPCPLTPLEKWFLNQASYPVYEGSFIEQYLITIIYPAGLTRSIELMLGLLVLAVNGPVYWWLLRTRAKSEQ